MAFLWYVAHEHQDYRALVCTVGIKSPRSYLPEEVQPCLRADVLGSTSEPEGLVISGTMADLKAFLQKNPHVIRRPEAEPT